MCPTPLDRTLDGARLHSFLSDVEESQQAQSEAGVAPDLRLSSLNNLLGQHVWRVDSAETLYRVQSLYANAGDFRAALALVEREGEHAVSLAPEDERPGIRLGLCYWRASNFLGMDNSVGQKRELERIEGLIPTLFEHTQSHALETLSRTATEAGAHNLARRCLVRSHELQEKAQPKSIFEALNDATLASRLATSFHQEGLKEQALEEADKALKALANAASNQRVTSDDWLSLGDNLIDIAPHYLDRIDTGTWSKIPSDLVRPLKREVEIRLARLQARAYFRLGKLEEAISLSRHGRYGLCGEGADEFSVMVLDWLVQAGQMSEAASLAFESVRYERSASAAHACTLALKVVSEPAVADPHWYLTLACAATIDRLSWSCGRETRSASFESYWARAQACSPEHPALGWLRGCQLAKEEGRCAQALSFLEDAVKHADFTDSDTVALLWTCRREVHGLVQAVRLPFVECASAGWNYSVGTAVDPDGFVPPSEDRELERAWAALQVRYYESGLRQFEAFFAGSEGYFRDADVHVYSMLCNNLAILKRYYEDDYSKALALHRAGFAASSFAEHLNGMVTCLDLLKDGAGFVNTADQLWHYSNDHGYGRHNPAEYVGDVAQKLHELGRDSEIAIWHERLDQWWEQLDQEDKQTFEYKYLESSAQMLSFLAETQPEDARVRLEALLPAMRQLRKPYITYTCGQALEKIALYAQAIEEYQTYCTLTENEAYRRTARKRIAECRRALGQGESRAWWKFWG